MKVRLAERMIKIVVKQLNDVLDENNILGQEFNKQVIKELILQNLTRNTTIELMKEIEETPICEFND